jgi:hypothetical protein
VASGAPSLAVPGSPARAEQARRQWGRCALLGEEASAPAAAAGRRLAARRPPQDPLEGRRSLEQELAQTARRVPVLEVRLPEVEELAAQLALHLEAQVVEVHLDPREGVALAVEEQVVLGS